MAMSTFSDMRWMMFQHLLRLVPPFEGNVLCVGECKEPEEDGHQGGFVGEGAHLGSVFEEDAAAFADGDKPG